MPMEGGKTLCTIEITIRSITLGFSSIAILEEWLVLYMLHVIHTIRRWSHHAIYYASNGKRYKFIGRSDLFWLISTYINKSLLATICAVLCDFVRAVLWHEVPWHMAMWP